MRKRLTKSILFVASLTLLALAVFPVTAQIKTVSECDDLGIPCTGDETGSDIVTFIVSTVNAFLILASVVAAIFIVYGGVQYVTSQGEQDKTSRAKSIIIYAIIGLIVIALSSAIVNFVIRPAPGGRNPQPPPEDGESPPPGGGDGGGGIGFF